MAQHDAPATDTAAAPEAPDSPDACSVCPHPWADHDALGVRFCTATKVSTNSRGCICRKVPVAA